MGTNTPTGTSFPLPNTTTSDAGGRNREVLLYRIMTYLRFRDMKVCARVPACVYVLGSVRVSGWVVDK